MMILAGIIHSGISIVQFTYKIFGYPIPLYFTILYFPLSHTLLQICIFNMKLTFSSLLQESKLFCNRFDEDFQKLLLDKLKKLSRLTCNNPAELCSYHNLLMFISAYPGNAEIQLLAEKEFKRISNLCKRKSNIQKHLPVNEGLPYQQTTTRFTPDFLNWLKHHDDTRVTFDSFNDPALNLNEVLSLTLPTVLKAETTAGLGNEAFLESMQVSPDRYLDFLLKQLESLHEKPFVRDLLFEKLDVYVNLEPRNKLFSRVYNRIPVSKLFFHAELVKQFDMDELLQRALPRQKKPDLMYKRTCIKVIKNSMALTARETDPVTYMDENSFRIYELERGISVAIYGMIPERQLPYESYVGFTLFKNGFPCSYGGAWVFGQRARFGMNILESFRGGESGYVMCQLLRVYKQVFSISCFEIEPYQYGLDNPDGIKSGAFWFYYRFGFRPMDNILYKLAETEQQKIKKRKNYRSSDKILLKFTQSNLELNSANANPPQVTDIIDKIKKLITITYRNDATRAEAEAVKTFLQQTAVALPKKETERKVLTEFALWAKAMNINNREKLSLLATGIRLKTGNLYRYQQQLIEFFN